MIDLIEGILFIGGQNLISQIQTEIMKHTLFFILLHSNT